jgi:hypothetical protein
MAGCSPSPILFPLPRKPQVVTADGGAITSEAGVLLLWELDARLGLSAALARCRPADTARGLLYHPDRLGQLGHRRPLAELSLRLPQLLDDLLRRMSLPLHLSCLSLALLRPDATIPSGLALESKGHTG